MLFQFQIFHLIIVFDILEYLYIYYTFYTAKFELENK